MVKSVATTKGVSIEMDISTLDLTNKQEFDNELLFMQLKHEVTQRVSKVQEGRYYSDFDLVNRYGLEKSC